MSNSKLSTTLVTIDKDYMSQHCLDREAWKKKWSIFNYRGFTASVNLSEIDISYGCYQIKMDVSYVPDKKKTSEKGFSPTTNYSWANVPFDREDFTSKMFNDKLISLFEAIVDDIAYSELARTPAYREYERIDQLALDNAKDSGVQYCKEHDIEEDSDIGEAIIDKFQSKANANSAYNYLSNNKKGVFPEAKAAFAYWFGNEDKAKQFESLVDPKWRLRSYQACMKKKRETEFVSQDE